jgi:hypothetical protein
MTALPMIYSIAVVFEIESNFFCLSMLMILLHPIALKQELLIIYK